MITVIGEALIHLAQTSDRGTLRARPGGTALNVAVAAARLGYPVTLLTRLSRDRYGQELRRYAVQNGVDVNGATDADEPTAIAIDSTGTVLVVRESGSVLHCPPPAPARMVDKAGAKEAFTAVLLGAVHDLAQKGEDVRVLPASDLAHLLGMASLAAGITSERPGADPPTAAELEERIPGEPGRR